MPRPATRVLTCLAALALTVGISACADGKPTKEELREALSSTMLNDEMSPEDRRTTEGTIDCFVDTLRSSMSADGLKALIAAANNPDAVEDPAEVMSEKDLTALAESGAKCTAEES
ncbi:hypothetical protein EII34_09900 [Arachnia propionica]|uniref:Uncharacterized protein n=1 Tax=Arachnia propionica TaxID=1750 RepID=A0A3P1T5X7_9ACTN|nr:hypothetical protein [Arachnia propionica]MDO5084011.1 hypothetical protein [Arachnia propionica]RRD04605.1 hypothetical protein EII34_09900 [Arachnia propionica]